MLKPQKAVYRVCPGCSSPIPLHQDECSKCGHSAGVRPYDTEAEQILRGKIFYNGRWVPAEEKIGAEHDMKERLSSGMVEYQGKWISIEEKIESLRRQSPAEAEKIVDFPIKPIPSSEDKAPLEDPAEHQEDEEEEASLSWVRMHRRRRILVVALSAISLLTMAGAAIGIVLKSGFSLF